MTNSQKRLLCVCSPVLPGLVTSGRSSAPISTACLSVGNTTTGSRTLVVSSGPDCKSIWTETSLYIVERKAVFNVCDSWFHTSRVRNPGSCQFVEKPSKWPSCSTCSQNSVLRSLTPAGSAARPTWFWDFYIFWTGLLTHFMSETSPRKGLILWVSSGSTPSQICCKCYCIQSQLLAGV